MYPDLSYLLHDLFGTPVDNALSVIQTFGFFLTMAVLVGGYLLYLELLRYEKSGILKGQKIRKTIGEGPQIGPLVGNGIVGFLIGFKLVYLVQHFEEFRLDAAGVILSGKGNLVAGIIAAILFAGWYYREALKKKLPKKKVVDKMIMPHERVADITIIAAITGILGARIFSILENIEDFLKDPLGQLLSGSGLTIYGGLILAFIVLYFYVKKKNITPIHVMDAVAPSLILGYAIGRLGCHFSGDGDWGIVNELAKPGWFILPEWMWAYDYPHNVINSIHTDPLTGQSINIGEQIPDCGGIKALGGNIPQHCTRLKNPVFPTPIYEAILAFIIFLGLWLVRKRVKIAGMLFAFYMILNGIERFFIEGIRVNEKYEFLNLGWSLSQYIAVAIFVTGLVLAFYLFKRGKKIEAKPANT